MSIINQKMLTYNRIVGYISIVFPFTCSKIGERARMHQFKLWKVHFASDMEKSKPW